MNIMDVYLRRALLRLCDDEIGAVESAQIFAWIVVTVIAIMALGRPLAWMSSTG